MNRSRGPWGLAALAVPAACAAALLWSFVPPRTERGFQVAEFAALPVLDNGRIKPVDTVARTAMLELCGKQVVRGTDGRSLDAVHWFLETTARSDDANNLEVFAIDDPDVTGMLGIQTEARRRFAFKELAPKLDEIERQAQAADQVSEHERSRFQRNILHLHEAIYLYRRIQNTLRPSDSGDFPAEVAQFSKVLPAGMKELAAHQHGGGKTAGQALRQLGAFFDRYRELDEIAAFRPLPPAAGEGPDEWSSVGKGLLDALTTGTVRDGTVTWFQALAGWADHDPKAFNVATAELRAQADLAQPAAVRSAEWEALFNRVAPFYQGMVCYVIALLLAAVAWTGVRWGGEARRAAFGVFVLAFLVHSAGLVARIVLQGRPPVTNLYSSAVYVGWVAVLLGWFLERRSRDGIALAVASAIGFATLIIAHHLALQGDSMEMLRAVLDSNFWLATHVTSVTTGYASTFLAGSLATWYILRGVLARSFDAEEAKAVSRMTYGVVCFSLFFSFTGTVLGGIWADQSWGRFWGWDPKENGALLIVLWNAILLHVRWGRMVAERELMALVVFGNVVTALSWFGVNMLGIGLHSYGFMDKAFMWLVAFCVVQLAIIAAGLMPLARWRGARGVADR